MLEINQIYNMDCIQGMRQMDSESVNCCVTSPPYWGLRDYGVSGQIGLEETPEQYVEKMVEVFREVRRVLKSDGTLWLNLGDTYAGSMAGKGDTKTANKNNLAARINKPCVTPIGLKPKDLIGIPWKVAFALQADGWYLRSDIIWAKTNPMPESVTDRPTKSHEYIFLFSKSSKYYYDYEAIKEPAKESNIKRLSQDLENQAGSSRANGGRKTNGTMRAVGGRKYSGEEWSPKIAAETYGIHDRKHQSANGETYITINKRSVWNIATNHFSEAHFATFPPKLIEPCILAGCPIGGVAFDPFMGSGTTAQVATQLQRNFIGLELNPTYIEIAEKNRLNSVQIKMV